MAECVGKAHTLARRERELAADRGAGVEPTAGAPPERVGNLHAAAAEELAAVAGPLRDALQPGQHQEAGAAAEAGARLALLTEYRRQFVGLPAVHGAPRAARGAQLPLDHGQCAQPPVADAFVPHLHLNQLHAVVAVGEEGGLQHQVAVQALEHGVALAMPHAVPRGAPAAAGRRERNQLARVQILQQVVLEGRILHRVVRPGRELVHLAVARPGVAGTRFRNLEAEAGIGDHVDPGARRAMVHVHLEAELAAVGIEAALRRMHRVRQLGGIRAGQQGHALRQRRIASGHGGGRRFAHCGHLRFERPAIGREHHAREAR